MDLQNWPPLPAESRQMSVDLNNPSGLLLQDLYNPRVFLSVANRPGSLVGSEGQPLHARQACTPYNILPAAVSFECGELAL